jgi:D-glycero-D-manno-heptose 1,7-bisphosphate phosphatase
LKIECGCRKPEIELFKQIANDFEIDYQNSWLVGDQESDAKAAYAFNIAYVNISSHPVVKDRDLAFNSLLDFAKFLRNSLE